MNSQQVDQTASEVHLHRAMWFIAFLRASVLHMLLLVVGVLSFIFAGTDGLYPFATALIQGTPDLLRMKNGKWVSAASFLFTVVVVTLLLWWIYRAVTRVNRRSLRLQAVLFSLWCINTAMGGWMNVTFAYQHLHAFFAVLVGVATLIGLILQIGIALTLWGVSRSPEHSSFIATLDGRLIPNFWVRFNKIVDLPRTPMRTPAAAGAYVLSLAGALILIASMFYLITVGGIGSKADYLVTSCARRSDLTQRCVGVSLVWAWQMLFGLLLAFTGIKVSALLRSLAKRIGGLNVDSVLKTTDTRFLLYLRPFDVDDVILPKPRLPLLSRFFSFRPFPVRIEEELFDVADGYRPLIAIGKPGSKVLPGGAAYRTYLDDSAWQDYVLDKIRRADRIVMVLKDTDGVRWEFAQVLNLKAISKTLFLFDPAMQDARQWDIFAKSVVSLLHSAGVVPQDFDFQSHPLGFFFQKGGLVEIVNTNWTATSYRTAFSHFLAESLN